MYVYSEFLFKFPSMYIAGSLGGEAQCAVYSRQVVDYLHTEKGFSIGTEEDSNLFFMVDPGGKHNEASWGNRFHVPIETLYPATTV